MKLKLSVAALALSIGGVAHAQTAVYGIVDAAVRSANNVATPTATAAAPASGSQLSMQSGYLNTSRWGIKGTEDMGGGLKANFVLEGDLVVPTGSGGAGTLFNRLAMVGVQGDFGRVDAGRDYNEVFWALAYVDPLGFRVAPQNQNILQASLNDVNSATWGTTSASGSTQTAIRENNMVEYTYSGNGLTFGFQQAFGGVAGSTGAASSTGARLGWTGMGVTVYGATQSFKKVDNTDKLSDNALGAKYAMGDFAVSATMSSAKVQSTGGKRTVVSIGGDYKVTPVLDLFLVNYNTKIENGGLTTAVSAAQGTTSKTDFLAEYSLSKRTAVYGLLDMTKFKDAAIPATTGKDSQTGITVGVRTAF